MTVVVKRSALKMWLMAVGGIPLLVMGLDVLTERTITRWLTDLVFLPEDVQIYEPRDVIFAWVILLFGVLFVSWGLKELFIPTKVLECQMSGLALKINGPFRQPTIIPWDNVAGVRADEVIDEEDRLPLLVVDVHGREGLPENPWGARWVGQRELGLMAQDWAVKPALVADAVRKYSSEAARERPTIDTTHLWQEDK